MSNQPLGPPSNDGVQWRLGKLESTVDRIETQVDSIRLTLAKGKGAWIRDLALLLPLYALVADLIASGFHH